MKSLRAQIVLFAVVVALLVAGAAGVLVHQVERYGREQTEAQLLETTRALSLVVSTQLEGHERLLSGLAASDAMRTGDYAAVDRQARAAVQTGDAWITLGTRDGSQLINTRLPPGATLPTGNLPPDIWAELDRGRPRVCNLVKGLIEPQITCIDVPIIRDGRAQAHLTLVMRPRVLEAVVAEQRLPPGYIAAVLDRTGTVLWRNVTPEKFVGRPATPDMRRQIASRPEGLFHSVSLDGVETTAAFSRSRKTGWTFVVAVPREKMDSGAVMALKRGAAIAAVFLLVAALLGLLLAKRITSAVARLGARASAMADPNAPHFVPTGISEVDAVGLALETALSERNTSRETFDLAQDVGAIGAWQWDFRRDERVVTDTFRRMHGLGPGPLTQRNILDTIHPDDLPGYIASLEAGKARRGPSDVTYRVLHKDGSVCWVAARGRPIFDASGALTGAIGVVRDATKEHEAEETLKRLNQALERQVHERTEERDRLWAISRDPFVVADDNGVWLEASPAWTEILGYQLDELVGRTSEWMEHPDDRVRTREEDRKLASGLITERFVNRFKTKDGE
jgi:PAS domain S-box-containing protein